MFTNINILLAVNLVLFIAFIVTLVGYFKVKKEKADLDIARVSDIKNNETLLANIKRLEEEKTTSEKKLNDLSDERVTMISDINVLRSEISKLSTDLNQKSEALEQSEDENTELTAHNAALKAEINSTKILYEEQQKRFDTSYKELQEQLKVMGHELVKNASEDLNKNSNQTLSVVVNPLKEELSNFKKLLTDSQETTAKRHGELQKEIELLEKSHSTLSKQAEDLTNALKQGGKSQGMWGELQLERVLDSAGLVKGIEYEREVAGDRSLGEMGRPDAIVNLPEKRCIIIDAKCSLTAYINYINAQEDSLKESYMKDHIASIKSHLNELIKKDYSSYQSLNSPSFVFMFVPVDNALTDALREDTSLYDLGAKNKIYLVSPSSIMPALRVVSNLWILSEQTEHMRSLAALAQKILGKFNKVEEGLDLAIKAETNLSKALSEVDNRLRTGKGNLKNMLSNFDANSTKKFKELDGNTIEAEQTALSFEPANE